MSKNRTFLVTVFFLFSCGGGGGGGSEPTPTVSVAPTPPPAPTSSTFDELKAEFEGYYEYRNHSLKPSTLEQRLKWDNLNFCDLNLL